MTDIDGVINLRSDTQSLPTAAMRAAMADAELGDETFGEDPTVRRLEERIREMTGMEAALLLVSGTMANLVALMTHCVPGDEVFLDADAHVLRNEAAGLTRVAGVVPTTVESAAGHVLPSALDASVTEPDIHRPTPRLVWIENTHNRAGGTVLPAVRQDDVIAVARKHGLSVHVDGARLWNAVVASGETLPRLLAGVDSVYLDLTKGLGCPLGAVLAGTGAFIERARRHRRVLGGGMRQAGVIAACGLVALESGIERLGEDHETARWIAAELTRCDGLRLDPPGVETNIIFLDVSRLGGSARVQERLRQAGVLVSTRPPAYLRLLTHLQITPAVAAEAVRRVRGALADLAVQST
jgi:threonine aldolase